VGDGGLILSISGKGAIPLETLSEDSFYFPGGFPIDFVKNKQGEITSFIMRCVAGDDEFVRVNGSKR
jgi:hypothetical protein